MSEAELETSISKSLVNYTVVPQEIVTLSEDMILFQPKSLLSYEYIGMNIYMCMNIYVYTHMSVSPNYPTEHCTNLCSCKQGITISQSLANPGYSQSFQKTL